ncbi:MAG: hypothetical protein QOG05_6819 [Streptosporangiaceae bacterium]|jgi:hypothetical protein|nr:hypothetical protein [Streptosporangiaceae bacterium]
MNRGSRPGRPAGGGDQPGTGKAADHLAVPEPRDGHQPDGSLASSNGLIGALVAATYEGAVGSRSDGAPVWGYRAVARLSGHLAAMQRAVYPAAGRRPGENRQLLQRCRAEARETGWALRVLECHLTGNGVIAAREPGTVERWIEQCLDEYRAAEQALIAWMQERLTARECEELALGYRAALARAPTRPHPRGPHAGWPGWIAFRFHVLWDRVLDGVDSRPGVRPDRPRDTSS